MAVFASTTEEDTRKTLEVYTIKRPCSAAKTISKGSIRWVHTGEVSRLKLWQELKYTCEHERPLTVISVHIRFQTLLEAIEGVNQDTR